MFLKFNKLSIITIFILTLALTSCTSNPIATVPNQDQPITKSDYILGTIIDITIYDKQDESIIDKAMDRIREIEAKMTINNAETSEIIALNEAAGKSEVKVSPDTFDVLERAKYYSELTKGLFDPTVGSIVKLWNIGTDYAADEVASVSIITTISMDGDGNSTSVLLLGLEEGMKFVESQEGVDAIFVTYDKKVYVTSGIKDIFTVTNSEFTLMN